MDRDVSGIIDAIDGALYDGADAMRWVPPQARTEEVRRAADPAGFRLTREQAAALRAIGRDVGRSAHAHPPTLDVNVNAIRGARMRFVVMDEAVLGAWGRALRDVRERLAAMAEPLERLGRRLREAFPDDVPPGDPRERALWLRQHRNTGPTGHPFTHRGATWQTSRTRPSAPATRTPGTSRLSRRAGRMR